MPVLRFIGVVLPLDIVKVSIGDTPQVTLDDLHGLKAEISIRIVESKVEVVCKLNRWSPDDLAYLYIRAMDFSSAAVDVITFSTGTPLTIVLHSFVNPDGQRSALNLTDPRLSPICTAYKLPPSNAQEQKDLDTALLNVFGDHRLFMALHDLTRCISDRHIAPVNCGRVLDGLRKILAPRLDPKQGWREMQRCLRIEDGYMQWVSNQSINPRHGDRSHIPGDITMELVKRTWSVMNRFLEFQKRGNHALSESEFPLLTP